MPEFSHRELFLDAEFEEQLVALISDPEAADEYVSAAQDLLSRLPESGRLYLAHSASGLCRWLQSAILK